jgi:hypothetical protein
MHFSRKVYALVLKLMGWKVKAVKPQYKKYVLLAAPHTSKLGFPYW